MWSSLPGVTGALQDVGNRESPPSVTLAAGSTTAGETQTKATDHLDGVGVVKVDPVDVQSTVDKSLETEEQEPMETVGDESGTSTG